MKEKVTVTMDNGIQLIIPNRGTRLYHGGAIHRASTNAKQLEWRMVICIFDTCLL